MPRSCATSATSPKPPKNPTLPGLEKPLKKNEQHPDGGQLPDWITEQLQANKTNGGSRLAKYHRCRKCKEIVLTGLTHDTCAWTATADPTPLNRKTELAAILTNRQTFQAPLDKALGGYRLDYRYPGSTWTKHPVIPAHKCGHRFPGFLEPPTNHGTTEWNVPDEPAF